MTQARSIQFERSAVDTERQTFEATLCSSVRCVVQGAEEILCMSGAAWPADGVPLLDSHKRDRLSGILGRVRNIRKSGCRLLGTLEFSQTTEGHDALAQVRAGHIDSVSIGYADRKSVVIRRGHSATVDGVRYTASENLDLHITRKFSVKEVSLCDIPADESSKIERTQENLTTRGSSTMAPAIHTRDRLVTRRVLSDALVMRGGGMVDDRRAEAADIYVNEHSMDLAKRCLALDGYSTSGDRSDQDLAIRALSGGALADVLNTTFDASLREAYGSMADSTEGWVYESSATNWFLFAPATEAEVVEVIYMDNQPEPTITPYDLSRGTWGKGFAIKHDIAACVVGWRGAYKSTGSA